MVLAGLLCAVLFVTAKALVQKYAVDRQIAQLQSRADQIRGQNDQLSDLVKYLNTDQYREKAAREQLNLKKDGEFVVAIPQNQQEQVASASTEINLSNPQKWYNYFFKHND